jgi:hypothetical protein
MHIAAPLSLDLDERPMPEPAHYPRRRPRLCTQPPRRPSTAPGALETGALNPGLNPGTSFGITEIASPTPAVVELTATAMGGEGEHGLIIEEDMDHLPPPRRPALPRSLSSVEQARRRGIQL